MIRATTLPPLTPYTQDIDIFTDSSFVAWQHSSFQSDLGFQRVSLQVLDLTASALSNTL